MVQLGAARRPASLYHAQACSFELLDRTRVCLTVFEGFLAETPMPPEIAVRPVTAGGVPALALGGEPAILYLHGGGHALGSAYGYRLLVGALVSAAGMGALVPNYRLAPEHPLPAAIEDALASRIPW
jgi:monoterpene epsilon-lactone hydrolase